MQGFALTTEQIIEIISAYSAPEREVDAVAATPGWNVIGAFPMPATAKLRLDVIGSVSHASLTLRCRLYCVTPGAVGVVSGSEVVITSQSDVEAFSGVVDLVGQRLYQIQCEVTGAAGTGLFGVVRRAAPAGQE